MDYQDINVYYRNAVYMEDHYVHYRNAVYDNYRDLANLGPVLWELFLCHVVGCIILSIIVAFGAKVLGRVTYL